ncbi:MULTISPECIES: hypothetical protein [unclassified Streptomyces]|uniref:hypothetical protein n=1 Tax=unclassified Streptomyces TaxID=2593676 RepID=UPI0020363ABB|nr:MULTISPECIES: hypothetical protein [unclassified Streptomyces]
MRIPTNARVHLQPLGERPLADGAVSHLRVKDFELAPAAVLALVAAAALALRVAA